MESSGMGEMSSLACKEKGGGVDKHFGCSVSRVVQGARSTPRLQRYYRRNRTHALAEVG